MPFDAGSILSRIKLDTSDFSKGTAQVKKETSDLKTTVKDFGASFQSMGMALAGVFGSIGASAALATRAMIGSASAAEEMGNLFQVSLGNMSGSATKWVQDLNSQLGMGETALKKMLGTFNVMIGSMGLGENEAYKMSKSLTQLVYDISSFYDLPTEEAFQKLSSGISGETEPLKRLGILINDDAVKSFALATGIIKAGQEMDNQQKVAGRYALIMQQTGKAQGDLTRTLGSWANQTRLTTASLTALATEFGNNLLPIFTPILQSLNSSVKSLIDFAKANQTVALALAVTVAGMGVFLPLVAGLSLALPGLIAYMGAASVGLGVLALQISAVTLGLPLLVAGVAALVYKMGESERARVREVESFTKNLTSVQALEAKYNTLAGAYGKVKAPSQELKAVTEQLAEAYKTLGIEIQITSQKELHEAETATKRRLASLQAESAAITAQINKIETQKPHAALSLLGLYDIGKEAALDKLQKRLDSLNGEFVVLAQAIHPSVVASREASLALEELNKAGIRSTAQIQAEIALWTKRREDHKKDIVVYQDISKVIEELQIKLTGVQKKEAESAGAALEKTIGSTGGQIRKQISLMTSQLSGETDVYNIRRLKEEIQKAQEELAGGEKPKTLKDYIGETEEATRQAISDMTRMQTATKEGSYNYTELGKAIKEAQDRLDGVKASTVESTEAWEKQVDALMEEASALRDDSYAYEQVINQLEELFDRYSDITVGVNAYKQANIETTEELKEQMRVQQEALALAIKQGDVYAATQAKQHLEDLRQRTSATYDLNQAGLQSNQQIQEQINKLETLRQKYAGNSDAVSQLTMQLAELRARLPEVSSASTQVSQGLELGFARLQQQWGTLEQRVADGVVTMANTITSGLSTAIMDVASRTKTAGQAFREFALNAVKALMEIITKLLLMQAIQGMTGGGGGGGFGFLSSLFGFGKAAAPAAAASTGPALVSMFAPLAAGAESVPFTGPYLLHSEEKVIPRYDAHKTATAEKPLTIQNLITTEAVARAMQSREGQGTIVNVINMNALERGTTYKMIRQQR